MKTAIMYSGQSRSFGGVDLPEFVDGLPNEILKRPWARETWPNQYWYLLRPLLARGDVEIFASLAEDKHAHEVEPRLLERFPKEKVHVEIVKQPQISEPPLETTFHGAYPIASPFQSILRDLWHRRRVWEFFKESGANATNFDCFVRLRPDIFFQGVKLPGWIASNECWTPWWAQYGGVGDRFAMMGFEVAQTYFEAFTHVHTLVMKEGCPMHPETLTATALEAEPNIVSRTTLNVVFNTLRRDGTVVTNEISESALSYLKAGVEAVAQAE